MKKITRIILSPFKRLIGLGYSSCECCGFPWNIVENHSIDIIEGLGCFATCEDCWRTKSDEEIIEAYNKLYDEWVRGNAYNKPHTEEEIGFTRNQMLSALEKALETRKK